MGRLVVCGATDALVGMYLLAITEEWKYAE